MRSRKNLLDLRRFRLIAGGILLATFGGPAAAQSGIPTNDPSTSRSVLELFTSQGCSSCPPADDLFHTFIDRPDVIALSMPVDYWDYLGWKDTLASSKFTARQKAYARDRGDGKVYTPQVVVNGMAHANGSSARDIEQAIQATAPSLTRARVPMSISLQNGRLVITATEQAGAAAGKESTIWLAVIQKHAEVVVRHGENHGRTLRYANVVRELTPVGMWSGAAVRVELDREAVIQPGATSCAVFIQSGKAGPILGAALLSGL